jgi:hypothetical protein
MNKSALTDKYCAMTEKSLAALDRRNSEKKHTSVKIHPSPIVSHDVTMG